MRDQLNSTRLGHLKACGLLTAIFVLQAALSGCTTMQASHYKQAVLIRSEPEGAKILADGKDVGVTPALVRLRRSHAPHIELQPETGPPRSVKLERNYRWRDSFFSNLVFLTYAPIGWLADLLTGTSWNIHDPEVVQLTDANATSKTTGTTAGNHSVQNKKKSQPVYALAPAFADTLALSDAASHGLEENLKTRQNPFKTLPYDQTLPTFVASGYDFDGAPDPDEQRDLYAELRTDGIIRSSIEPKNGSLILKSQTYDFYTQTSGEPIELNFKPKDGVDDVYSLRSRWFYLLPNTVSLDWSDDELNWSDSDGTINLKTAPSRSGWVNLLNAISSIGFTNLPARRTGRASRWQLSFVPVIHLALQNIEATNYAPLENQYFERTWASIGYGPEIGFQVSRHYFYLNVVPQAYWDKIQWARGDESFSRSGNGFTLQTEFGYLYFFNNNWAGSFFARTQTEDNRTWNAALSKASGEDFSLGQATRSVFGLSVNYRFEPHFNATHWFQK